MKRLFVLFLFITLSTSLLTDAHNNLTNGDWLDDLMIEKYSNWWEWNQMERDVIKNMFNKSTCKHNWFPEVFDAPPQVKFTIYPRGYHKKRMNEFRSREI